MKFQKLEVFEKHFKEAYPQHLSSAFVVVCSRESERKKILASVIHMLEEMTDFKRCFLIKDALEHLNAGSLFSGKMGAIFDGVEGLLKAEVELLAHYLKAPNPEGHLVLGAANAKAVNDLYKKAKKEMVVLDLSGEKPWEEKQRLSKWVVQTLHAKQKKVSPEAVDALLGRLPGDRLLLQQELDKLTCYVGERSEVTKGDVEAICSASDEQNLFQIAQGLVWGQQQSVAQVKDISQLLPLVSQVRNQLEMGLKMTALLKVGSSSEEIAKAFPRLWPKALQQCLEGARKKGSDFFKRGLLSLFDLEFGLKTNLGRPDVLFAIFSAKILSYTHHE
ncbi:MAG: hypothetical protein K1000chlam2_01506 [Chlamydiae bacterium]|nr:hypothetical protein [Chlamydiota bacterium]